MATATALRRTLTSRAHLLRCSRFLGGVRSSSFISYHSTTIHHSVQKHEISQSSAFFHRDFQRGFAKGRKSKDDNDTVEVIPDIGPSVRAAASLQMEAAVDALSRELSKLRTGRASAGMLDHIIIEAHGVKSPLSHLAVVSVIDAQTLSVTPYDPDAMCKIVVKASEDVKQSIRRARQKAFDTIKKASSSMPKDDVKRLEKEVDEMTKKFIKSAEDMCKAKEKEIKGS
ncbi:Ribosome-recycling factor [Nymphaea thermarum]|nr:Ribosome-recycling factor [Nymphaea thermarum]